MFKLAKEPQFTHTVPVLVPTDGGHREETIRARFRVISAEAIKELLKDNRNGVRKLLEAVIVSIDDVVDEAGAAVLYSDETRAQILAVPYAADALFRAYDGALTKARLGN